MMNDRLIAAVSDINDEMIIDAAPGKQYGQSGSVRQSERVQRRRTFYRIAAAAACLCVVVAVLAVVRPWNVDRNNVAHNVGKNNEVAEPDTNIVNYPSMPDYSACKGSETTEIQSELAVIGKYPEEPADIFGTAAVGMDMEFCPIGTVPGDGFIAPADVPEKLAVYRNEEADPAGFPKGLDKTQMMELIDMYAERLGINIDTVSEFIDKDETNKDILVWLDAYSGEVRIKADAGGHVMIQMPESMFPKDIDSVLSFEDQVMKQDWEYVAESYNEDGSVKNRIYKVLSYIYHDQSDPLKIASIWTAVEGEVYLHIDDYGLLAEKVDDYPVISPARALEKLKAGEYCAPLKNGSTLFSGEAQIVGLRIEYYLGPAMEYIVPFYVYTAMLPDVTSDAIYSEYGIKDAAAYAEYYIPAIDERYFGSSAMTWN